MVGRNLSKTRGYLQQGFSKRAQERIEKEMIRWIADDGANGPNGT